MRVSASDSQRLFKARRVLLSWFSKKRRYFFWRGEKRDPYVVLVAEIMLQQTQASRVNIVLPKFLIRFQSMQQLASAKKSDVIKMWQGLGYNRRALNLHKSAQIIQREHMGIVPSDENLLLVLPGVGLYTARAIQSFAFKKNVSVVDVNIGRVISRISKKMNSANDLLSVKDVHVINEMILPTGKSDIWHETLMDLGATVCKKKPQCDVCPVSKHCASFTILSRSSVKPSPTKPKEKQYFGYPKRIWRGKVLRIISNSKGVTKESLISSLRTSSRDSQVFTTHIEVVIQELIEDGFIKMRNKLITLV